jgi:hypothetical protein
MGECANANNAAATHYIEISLRARESSVCIDFTVSDVFSDIAHVDFETIKFQALVPFGWWYKLEAKELLIKLYILRW